MREKNYIGFAKQGNTYGPAEGKGDFTPRLPAGHYKVGYDAYNDILMVTKFEPRLDEILNLGCAEFNYVLDLTKRFLTPEAEQAFRKNGFLLKRSFLFYGPPGTGKSVLSSKIGDIACHAKDALVLYPESYDGLERMLEVLDATDKDRFKVISLEEFDDLVSGRDEASWTTLLDGQFQSNNRLVLATTNHVDEIPQRLLRPGRFSSLIHIPVLTPEARTTFLKAKNVGAAMIKDVVEKTEGFTIDELKEIVQCCHILGEPTDMVINGINARRNLGKEE